jgi:predicted Zn finger-like uncharacterized protein
MDHRITQCPRCGTSFRVTEAHLAVAAGAVRCGSCLHIFNAREHWAEDTTGTQLPASETAPHSSAATETAEDEPDLDDLIIDDDALFDDNTPLFAETRTTGSSLVGGSPALREEQPLFNEIDFGTIDDDLTADDDSPESDAPEQLTNAFSDLGNWEEDNPPRFGRLQDLDEELSASDEEWTRDLLRDDDPLAGQPFTARTATPADDSPARLFNEQEPFFGADESSREGSSPSLEPSTPAFDSPASVYGEQPSRFEESSAGLHDYGLVGAEADSARREPTFGTSDLAADATQGNEDLEFLDNDPLVASPASRFDDPVAIEESPATLADLNPEFLETPSAHRAGDTTGLHAPLQPGGAEPDEPDTIVTDESYAGPLSAVSSSTAANSNNPLASLDRLATEPLQIHQFRHEPRWPRIFWGAALIALLLLLAGQYAYKNFDTLARGETRPWMAKACALIGCILPPQTDIAQIRSGNLIVRSHPTRQGALVVDAIITNLATFPQPYPQLQLQFSDLNGTPVAGRRFHAAEYLAGELSGAALMPVQQPVHIALELVDPGPQAVNYALTVVAPPAAP